MVESDVRSNEIPLSPIPLHVTEQSPFSHSTEDQFYSLAKVKHRLSEPTPGTGKNKAITKSKGLKEANWDSQVAPRTLLANQETERIPGESHSQAQEENSKDTI